MVGDFRDHQEREKEMKQMHHVVDETKQDVSEHWVLVSSL
jgi:hypothetical protein